MTLANKQMLGKQYIKTFGVSYKRQQRNCQLRHVDMICQCLSWCRRSNGYRKLCNEYDILDCSP